LAGHELGEIGETVDDGVLGLARDGWGLLGVARWLGTVRRREQTVRKRESRDSREMRSVFWKMVYGKIFRKPFSSIYITIFRSNYKRFPLTLVLQRNKRPKMMKTFYGKRFTSKQTEP
jgi:hypothetical protein